MRILRIRRGYTTNSSSGNEYILPPRDHPQYREYYEYLKSEGRLPADTPPPLEASAELANGGSSPSGSKAGSNLGIIGLLMGAVALLFVLGGLARRLLRRRRS